MADGLNYRMTVEPYAVEDFSANGWQRRTRIRVDTLLSMENAVFERLSGKESPIKRAYLQWRQGDSGLCESLSYFDVTPEDPMAFTFHNYTSQTFRSPDNEGTQLRDFRLPFDRHASDCAMEYLTCKETAAPSAWLIEQQAGGLRREYYRIMMPLEDAGGNVTKVAYAFRHLARDEAAPTSRP